MLSIFWACTSCFSRDFCSVMSRWIPRYPTTEPSGSRIGEIRRWVWNGSPFLRRFSISPFQTFPALIVSQTFFQNAGGMFSARKDARVLPDEFLSREAARLLERRVDVNDPPVGVGDLQGVHRVVREVVEPDELEVFPLLRGDVPARRDDDGVSLPPAGGPARNRKMDVALGGIGRRELHVHARRCAVGGALPDRDREGLSRLPRGEARRSASRRGWPVSSRGRPGP